MTSKLIIPETIQLEQVASDPAAETGKAQIYAKLSGGVTKVFMRDGGGGVNEVGGAGAGVPSTRLISTTAPLAGGGDLSADRTHSITANGISDALIRQGAGLSVIGRSANTTGNVADVVAAADGDVLRRSGTTVGFGSVATAGIADNAVTLAKLADIATASFIGRTTAATGDPEVLSATQATALLNLATTGAKGLAPILPNDATKYLDGTGAYTVPAGGGGSSGGNFALPEVWAYPNVAANLTAAVMSPQISGFANQTRMVRSGSLVGLVVQLSEAITAGSLTVNVTKNGVAVTLNKVMTSGTGGQSTQSSGVDTYVAGDLIGVTITTNAGFLPITTDLEVWVEVTEATSTSNASSSTSNVVASTTLGSAASTISVSGLDGDTDAEYEIEFNYIASSAAAHDIDIRPNGDTGANRQSNRRIDAQVFTNSSGVIVANGAVTNALQFRSTFRCFVKRLGNYRRRFVGDALLVYDTTSHARWESWTTYSDTTANLTSLTFGVTNIQFAAGSELIVRKVYRTTGGSSGGGLFASILSTKPTSANTGFSSWYYQFTGSTVADSETGLSVKALSSGGTDSWTARARAVPSTPYSVKMLLSADSSPIDINGSIFVGWADAIGGKLQVYMWTSNYNSNNVYVLNVPGPTTNPVTTVVSALGTGYYGNPTWIRLTDDGTTVKVLVSRSGDTTGFYQVFSQTKSSGYLGASGYAYLVFGFRGLNANGTTILQSFQIE